MLTNNAMSANHTRAYSPPTNRTTSIERMFVIGSCINVYSLGMTMSTETDRNNGTENGKVYQILNFNSKLK